MMRRLPRAARHGVWESWRNTDEQTTITRLFDFTIDLYCPGASGIGVIHMIGRKTDDN